MKTARLGIKIIQTLVRDSIYYPGRLIVDTIGILVRCGVLLLLYYYVFSLSGGAVNGYSYAVIAWSIFLYFIFSVMRIRDVSSLIEGDVKSGQVEMLFARPISYLAYRVWWKIGTGTYSFLVLLVVGVLVMSLLIGIPMTMTGSLFFITMPIVFILSIILSFLVYLIIGVLAFWLEDIKAVFWVVDKSIMILGGSYFPVALFPEVLKNLALFSPFGASQFITRTVYDTWNAQWLLAICIQIFWIVILSILLFFMYKKARTKISVNGG